MRTVIAIADRMPEIGRRTETAPSTALAASPPT